MVEKDKIREMLRRDSNQRVLDEIAKFSFYTETKLRRVYVTGAVASKVFPGKKDMVSRTKSSIELFCSPEYEVLDCDEEHITVTETTLKYASK